MYLIGVTRPGMSELFSCVAVPTADCIVVRREERAAIVGPEDTSTSNPTCIAT